LKAFPNPNNTKQEGMDLFDYFAAVAMQSLIVKCDFNTDPSDIAKWAYDQAAAMMAYREELEDAFNK
jgi:hypothetical protein